VAVLQAVLRRQVPSLIRESLRSSNQLLFRLDSRVAFFYFIMDDDGRQMRAKTRQRIIRMVMFRGTALKAQCAIPSLLMNPYAGTPGSGIGAEIQKAFSNLIISSSRRQRTEERSMNRNSGRIDILAEDG